MKITLYTITDCPFSKQEREYLSAHGLPFEEKNLETNREFLTEMLAVGSNFAGTPLTKIEKDDGQIVVLKGFTLAEFDKTLGFAVDSKKPTDTKAADAFPVTTPPKVEITPNQDISVTPQKPKPITNPVDTAPPAVEQPITPVSQPEVPQQQVSPVPVEDPAMSSVLNNLQQQAEIADPSLTVEQVPVAPVTPATPEPAQPPVAGVPVIPDPQF